MGGGKSLQIIAAAAKDPSAEVQDVATRLLGEWMNAEAAPVLLDLAQHAADPKYRIRALRGYIRIARQLDVPLAQRMAICRRALEVAPRDEEKKLVLQVLPRYPAAEGLELAIGQLQNATLMKDVAVSALAVAEKLVETQPAVVAEAMKRLLAADIEPALAARAKALREQAEAKGRR
jgi:hypothetical protein